MGATRSRRVQANIVAASNADFTERIAQGRFRQDLYFRLARFTVEVPPLRNRREDIPLLIQHFSQLFAREMNLPAPRISEAALRALTHYDYPGNVRELKNILERALMESEGEELHEQHLHFFAAQPPHRPAPAEADATPPPDVPPADSSPETAQVLAYVRTYGAITNAQARVTLNTDRNHACYVLRKLTEQGALACHGHGRWARYRLP